MAELKRLFSSVLLAVGMLLVFDGLLTALGFTASGMVISIAVVVALIYTGAVWFSPPSRRASAGPWREPLVFDRAGLILSGAERSRPLTAQFSDAMRAEVAQHAAAAFAGLPGRLTLEGNHRGVELEFLPVRNASGVVVFGIVVASAAMGAVV